MKTLVPQSLHELYDEMREFYLPLYSRNIQETECSEHRIIRAKIFERIETFMEKNPNAPVITQKSYLHEQIAEHFVPQIFPHSPFYFEMGLKPAENWGCPVDPEIHAGSWIFSRNIVERDQCEEKKFLECFQNSNENHSSNFQDWDISTPFWSGASGFDSDHHCLGYSRLLKLGVNGVLNEIAKRKKGSLDSKQAVVLEAMEVSCNAVLKIARRFREKAAVMLTEQHDPQARGFLKMIADSANVPANPPRSFYEGLLMVWFLREMTGTIEAIGISVVGHLDRQLYHLYRDDLERGVINEESARDLIARWMLPTDVKCHVWDRDWPETSTCLELGGCDETGKIVWNDLTRLFIDTHHECRLINPKLNCRYSCESPKEYLELMLGKILEGHNHFAFLNDDVLIPANIAYGKTLEDARLYVNGGCQETICEGVEHSAGAYYYFNLLQALSLCLRERRKIGRATPKKAAGIIPEPINRCDNFDDFLSQFMSKIKEIIKIGAEWRKAIGENWGEVNPCPWFSAGLDGCVENAKDYADGGAKYNMSGITLVGLGSLIDSLVAVKIAVFEEKWLDLDTLKTILAHNWEGHENTRKRILSLPRYGHGNAEVDQLSAKISDELAEYIKTLPNERGEFFQPSYFVYYHFKMMGSCVGATPDGRFAGNMMAQGIAPHRVNAPESLTDVLRTINRIDFCKYPGNAVLDVQLPLGSHMSINNVTSILRIFAQAGGATLQLNSVSVEQLKKAQLEPDNYQDLVVRISGLSACFVSLSENVQNEIINRALMTV